MLRFTGPVVALTQRKSRTSVIGLLSSGLCRTAISGSVKLRQECLHCTVHRNSRLPAQQLMKLPVGVAVPFPFRYAPAPIENCRELSLRPLSVFLPERA